MTSRTLDVTLNAKDNLSPAFQKAGNSAKTLGDSLNAIGKNTSGFQSFTDQVKALDSEIKTVGQALTGFGAGITAAVGLSVRSFASFESAMTNVGTIAGQSEAWLASMADQVRALAVELGESPTGLAEGLYDIIGSGVDATDALDVLRTSAVAAKAGLTDTGTAARAITAILNAYGMAAQDAGDVSDVLFKTVDSGVITFEQLANNLGNTIPLAAQLGVTIEELGAGYAQLTVNGVQASQAETQLAALMRATINETEALTAAVNDYGFASAEALIQTEGLSGFLQFLIETSGGSSAALRELLGTAEAVNAALILSKDNGQDFIAMLDEMTLAAQGGEYTGLVFEQQADTIAGAVDRLQASLANLSIVAGEAFAPFLRAGVEAATGAINGLAGAIESLPGPLQAAAAGVVGLTGGTALLAGGFLLLLPRIVETRAALQTLGGVRGTIGLLAGAFNPLTLAITGALGVGVLIYENMRRGAEAAQNYAASVDTLAEAVERLRIMGDDTRANLLESLQQEIDTAVSEETIDNAIDAYERLDLARQGIDPTTFSLILQDDFNRAIAMADEVNLRIGEALSNPNIDAKAYSDFVNGLMDTIVVTAEGSNVDEVFTQILTTPLSDFRIELDETMSTLEQMSTVASGGLVGVVDRLGDAEEMLVTLAQRASDFRTTLDDIRIGGDFALASQLQDLDDLFKESETSSEAYLEAQDRIFDSIRDGSVNFDTVRAAVADLTQQYLDGDIGQAQYEAGIILISQTLSEYTAGSQAAIDRTRELTQEFTTAALAIAGWDNALSQLNLTGMTGELGLFAEEGIRAGQAFDNTFRILVTNVQQFGQGIQQATDWMEDLVTVNDEGWSKVGQLVSEQRISWEQGEAAVAAYNQTLEANYDIQQNLLAVQALQAPYIAESVAATQAWVAELAQMPAEVQRTALAFADLQTVQQAQEIITLGNSDAFQAMGDSGVAAFTQVIQGALQTNPLLFNVLETMGIINGTPLDFTVNMDALEAAGGAMDRLIENIGNLVDTLRQIYGLPPLEIEADVTGVEDAQQQLNSLRDLVLDPTGWAMKIAVEPELVQQGTTTPFGRGTFAGDYAAGWRQFLGIPDQVDVPVDVQIQANATVGDGTGGANMPFGRGTFAGDYAAGYRSFFGIPESVDVPVEVTITPVMPGGASLGGELSSMAAAVPDVTITTHYETTGTEALTEASDLIAGMSDKTVTVSVDMDSTAISDVMTLLDTINTAGAATMTVDVVIGTNELDTGLTGWGLGTGGGGGGGAAGYEGKQVSVDIVIGDNELDTALAFETPPSVEVMVDANVGEAQMKIDFLGKAGEKGAPTAITVMVDADTSAAATAITDLTTAAGGVPTSVSITAVALTEGAVFALDNVTAAANAIPESESVTVSAPGAETATGLLTDVTAAANGIPESETVSVSVSGAAAAIGALNSVAEAAASIPSSVSTTITTNRVTNTIQTYSTIGAAGGGFATSQHGGIPSYATGGVLFRAAEGNRPEIAHFAGGGTALLPRDGLYMAPPMTYISPHNSGASYGGDTYQGDTIEVHIHGNVYGIDDLADAMEGALTRRRRAYGLGAPA